MWLANTGQARLVVGTGIKAAELEVRNNQRCVVVHGLEGERRLYKSGPKKKLKVDTGIVRSDS